MYVYLHRHLLCNYWLLAPPVWHLPWISGQDPSLFSDIQNIDPCRLKKWEMNMTNFSVNLNLGEGWHASLCMQVKWPTWLELILVSFAGLKSTYSTPAWRVSPSFKFARGHLHHRAEWHFELKVSSPKYQCTRGHRVSTLDHLIRIPVHWLLHHCASTNQECNERKLPTCVYSLVHNWANTSSLTKAMVLSFCQTSTGKCMHHPTEKK